MVITEAAVTNAMNLAFFMVNLSRRLVRDRQGSDPNASVRDLKAHYRGRSYAEEVIKLLPEKPEPGLLRRLMAAVTGLGRIHPRTGSLSALQRPLHDRLRQPSSHVRFAVTVASRADTTDRRR